MIAPCVVLAAFHLAPAASADPSVFSPGVVSSGAHDSAPAFSPDGKELFIGRSTSAASMILVSRQSRGGWSSPRVAPFSGQWLDMEPTMAPDGSYIVFVSNRPAVAGGAPIDGMLDGKPRPGKGANLWRVDRIGQGWGEPRRLPDVVNANGSIYAPSIAADGTLYFMKPSTTTARFQLFKARSSAQGYDTPQPLPFSDGSVTDVDPAVAPDQSFIIFGSGRRARTDIDLYVSHRNASGWDDPIYLGEPLNSRTSDAEPRLSPDGRTLFFSSERIDPVASPIAQRGAPAVAAGMSAWNNGLYNIWQAEVAPLLAMKPVAAPQPTGARTETQDEAGVRAAEQRWSQAFVSGDRQALTDLLDPAYVSVNAKGQARTSADVIAAAVRYAAAHPGEVATPLSPNVRVRVMGPVAIVQHSSAADRSVDVLRHEGGRWVAVYSQHTAVSPAG